MTMLAYLLPTCSAAPRATVLHTLDGDTMPGLPPGSAPMPLHQPVAINHSQAHENRIHSDDVARAYGFTGALVPGVAVFGHMTYPLTNELGVRWLGHSRVALRLHKPAYNGDRLSVPLTQTGERTYRVDCYNAAEVLLAQVSVELPSMLPPVDP